MIEAIQDGMTDAAANVAVGFLILILFAGVICAVFFFLMLVRSIWRWLTRRTWGDVIRSTETKAFRAKVIR
jgi:predicted permease